MTAKVSVIGKLSDHAAAIMRQRGAKGCMVIVVEEDGKVAMGIMAEKLSPPDMQAALCEAIVFNHEMAHG